MFKIVSEIEKIREIEKSAKSKNPRNKKNRKIHEIEKSRNIFLLDAEFLEKKSKILKFFEIFFEFFFREIEIFFAFLTSPESVHYA